MMQMSDVFFHEIIPKPNYHLGVGNLSNGAMAGWMFEKIEDVLIKKPDYVIVYGDANSNFIVKKRVTM